MFSGEAHYTLGMFLAFAACATSMTFEERLSGQPAGWGSWYPRLVALLALAFESAITGVLAKLMRTNVAHQSDFFAVFATDLGLSAFRIAALVLLVLSQTSALYASTFVPHGEPSERQSLLNNAPTPEGPNYGTQKVGKPKNPLRSTRPPPKRPPPLESLSILTLFSRVRTLFPYLWPKKSIALQLLAFTCFALMLVKRFTQVAVPLLFGKIAEDLSTGARESLQVKLMISGPRLKLRGDSTVHGHCALRRRSIPQRFQHNALSLHVVTCRAVFRTRDDDAVL